MVKRPVHTCLFLAEGWGDQGACFATPPSGQLHSDTPQFDWITACEKVGPQRCWQLQMTFTLSRSLGGGGPSVHAYLYADFQGAKDHSSRILKSQPILHPQQRARSVPATASSRAGWSPREVLPRTDQAPVTLLCKHAGDVYKVCPNGGTSFVSPKRLAGPHPYELLPFPVDLPIPKICSGGTLVSRAGQVAPCAASRTAQQALACCFFLTQPSNSARATHPRRGGCAGVRAHERWMRAGHNAFLILGGCLHVVCGVWTSKRGDELQHLCSMKYCGQCTGCAQHAGTRCNAPYQGHRHPFVELQRGAF